MDFRSSALLAAFAVAFGNAIAGATPAAHAQLATQTTEPAAAAEEALQPLEEPGSGTADEPRAEGDEPFELNTPEDNAAADAQAGGKAQNESSSGASDTPVATAPSESPAPAAAAPDPTPAPAAAAPQAAPAEPQPVPAAEAPQPPAEQPAPAAAAPPVPAPAQTAAPTAPAPAPTAASQAPAREPAGAVNAGVPIAPRPTIDTGPLMARGQALLGQGDIAGARLFFERAAEHGDGAAMMAMGRSFDPIELRRLGVLGLKGDANRAMQWYRSAATAGDASAEQSMGRLSEYIARSR